MKVWLLAGLVSLVAIPSAFASEDASACGMDTRRDIVRSDVALSVPGLPPAEQARQTRQVVQGDTDTPAALAPAIEAVAEGEPLEMAETPRPRVERRRVVTSVQRVPDAVLIGGRGIL